MLRSPLRRPAALAVLALGLTASLASAGTRPELAATAGLRPAATVRALAARTRASSTLAARAVPASIDERYDVPSFLWATRDAASPRGQAARTALKPSAEAAARQHLGLVS